MNASNSHYGSFEARRVRAPGLHRPQNRLLVGRVPSPGGPVWCRNENYCMNARSLSSARISPSLERSVVIGLALALALGAAAQPRDGLTNSLGIQLISVPAGEFSMGQ